MNNESFNHPNNEVADSCAIFAQLLHKYGGSPMFLAGLLLLVGGGIVSAFSMFGVMNSVAVFTLLALALPSIALFMLYSVCANKMPAEKFSAPLTMLKVYVIISLIFMGLLLVIAIAGMFFVGSIAGVDELLMAIIFAVLIGAIIGFLIAFTLLLIFYYIPLLRIISDIRSGLFFGNVKKIRGVVPLTVMACIAAGSAALTSLSDLSAIAEPAPYADFGLLNIYMGVPGFDWSSLGAFYNPTLMLLMALSAVMSGVGTVLLLVVLNRFNKAVKQTFGQ